MTDTFVRYSDLHISNDIDFAPQNVKKFVELCLTIIFAAIRISFPVCIQNVCSCFAAETFLLM